MENASKALIMAGAILIALLILSCLVYMWTQASAFSKSYSDEEEQKRITAFNREYESYQKQYLRGTDIITIINKVRNNNTKYTNNVDQITWEFKLVQKFNNMLNAGTYNEQNCGTSINNIINNPNIFKTFKELYFKCTKIEYSSDTGKVNKIVFIEQKASDIFE